VARENVIRVLHDILAQSGTIRRLVDQRKIALVGAMYDVASAEIEFFMDEAIGLDVAAVPVGAG
jgi:carbonic anhydrase/SulP family sulfate permease